MSQGAKNSQSTKVDKKLVKATESKIGNLMNLIGKDDDIDDDEKDNYKYNHINNNNYNINYNFGEEYEPEYSKRKIENKNNNFNIETDININKDNDNIIESSLPRIKPHIIKREKKVIEKEDDPNKVNNTSFHMRTGIKRTIKQQEELSNNISYSSTYNKTIFPQRDNTVDNSESKDNNYNYISFNKTKNKLPIDKDNSIIIFWYDAIEESFNNKPNVIFFGKIFEPQSNLFKSISIIIKDIFRTVLFYQNLNMKMIYKKYMMNLMN